jgi:hypothetical protein
MGTLTDKQFSHAFDETIAASLDGIRYAPLLGIQNTHFAGHVEE